KLIVRLVFLKRPNHIVAIPPGVRQMSVIFKPFGLGETCDIEPMLSPPFTIVRTGQQPIDQPRPGIRRIIVDEVGTFLRTSRQSGQVEVASWNERLTVRLPCRSQPYLVQFGEDECIDRIADPQPIVLCIELRDGRICPSLQRPMIPLARIKFVTSYGKCAA